MNFNGVSISASDRPLPGRRSAFGATSRITAAIATSRTEYRTGTTRQLPGTNPPSSPVAGTSVRIEGTSTMSSLVPDAPTLPAPNTPRANPFDRSGNHAEHQAIPTVNEFPDKP